MDSQNPVISARLDDLCFEAVLDHGFMGDYSFSADMHSHPYYELILAASGAVWIEPALSAPLCLKEGQACLLTPGSYHRVLAADSTSKKLAVRFHYAREGTGTLFMLLNNALQRCNAPVFIADSQLLPVFLHLQKQLHCTSATRPMFLQNLLQQTFLLLIDQLSAHTASDTTPDMLQAPARRLLLEEFLEENFRNPVTEETLARYMHLSKRQVSRVLMDFYGKSFRKLLVEMRLQEAARLLCRTSLPIEEIAAMVGYTSMSGFYSAFRKMHGTTAGSYRKTHKSFQ